MHCIKNAKRVPTDSLEARWFRMRDLSKITSIPHIFLLQFKFNLNCKTMKKTKDIQVKFFKEESIFNLFDTQSLTLYRQMMADRYANLHNEEE